MKISKLLFLGMLAVVISLPIQAADIAGTKGVVPASPNIYYLGDTIHYHMTLSNNNGEDENIVITSVTDILPNGSVVTLDSTANASYKDFPFDLPAGATETYDISWPISGVSAGAISNRFRFIGYQESTVQDNFDLFVDKGSLIIAPSTDVGISASDDGVCAGGTVDLTITELNDSDDAEDLDPAGVDLFRNDVYWMTLLAGDLAGGVDIGGDGVLSPGETWTWNLSGVVVGVETTYKAIGHGIDILGNDVTWCDPQEDPPADTICDQDELAETTVTVLDTPDCGITGPPEMCANQTGVEYCATVEWVEGITYSWTITAGDATIDDDIDDQECVNVTPGTGDFTLSLEICLDGCCSTCDIPVTVIPHPDCIINSGPRSLCEGDTDPIEYCSEVLDADGYYWQIMSGPATIPGDNASDCVVVVPTGEVGTIVLQLELFYDVPGAEPCGALCQIEIEVGECGGGFCTFTQGYYGNAGGTQCDGLTTTEIINQAGLPVIVGVLGERSIELTSAACIIERLPAGGKPSALPSGIGDLVDDCGGSSTAALVKLKLLKKQNKNGQAYQNVLIGQVVALTLNMRLHTIPCMDAEGFEQALGDYTFPDADYICVQKGEEGCIERYEIPEILKGMPVSVLLELANEALAGDKALIGGAYAGASFVNELFDECLSIVTCPIDPVEICDNDCDDDFDGTVDENVEEGDCIVILE